VLKGLLIENISRFDTLVLLDSREKDGSLLNNLEFLLYYFLFYSNGLAEKRKIKLVGSEEDISQALRLLRLTLLGPTEDELKGWNTTPENRKEWLGIIREIALQDDTGKVIPVEGFFDLYPFDQDGKSDLGSVVVEHLGIDIYQVRDKQDAVEVDLGEDQKIDPSYRVQSDYIPGGLVKLGMEVLGGASGFTLDEPCTGMALCFNGDYLLIDSLPFLDQNLFARGIAKNQVSAVFLTHLHDDHCCMFPLMLTPHRVDVITTREIFEMAMEKLAYGLGWDPTVIAEHFRLVEVKIGQEINYFGLHIRPHLTVHSIPTIGATFSTKYRGMMRRICIVGDNNSMESTRRLHKKGIVRESTLNTLENIFTEPWNMLVADGGEGAIHGDPRDAIKSRADRVVFVHVDELPREFTNTFSLASSGKRYTVIEGDSNIYTSQVSHYLSNWLNAPFPNRWMRSMLAEEEIRRYNQGDVILVQDEDTRGYVYLILTGYCEVVRHDGHASETVAKLQAGDIVGEMAVITGRGIRNASVVAASPATLCLISEDTFKAFIDAENFRDNLITRWQLRPYLKALPQFSEMESTSLEAAGSIADIVHLNPGDVLEVDNEHWYIVSSGKGSFEVAPCGVGTEFGWRPLSTSVQGAMTASTKMDITKFRKTEFEHLRLRLPAMNFSIRKYRVKQKDPAVNWLLGKVSTLKPLSLHS
jgi:CRP-like cAMP-binding protein